MKTKVTTMIDSEYALRIYAAVFISDEDDHGVADVAGIFDAISTLTEREQQALEFRFKDGYTYKQIAEQFGLSSTMGSRIIQKALLKLKHQSRSRLMKY